MSTKVEKALELHGKGYNCAQAVACSFCEEFGVDQETMFKISEGFGFGMGMMDMCGAVTGMMMVIGMDNSIGNLENGKATKADTYKKTKEFAEKYPGHAVKNISQVIAELRMQKDGDEVALVREAIGITDKALQYVMKHLEPGMAEYQAQADFEYMIRYNGAEGTAFPTIAGSGANGTMLHYDTNLDICEDGSLLLMDLGAKYRGYCADITRTYPVNGTYTERQRQVYDIVLAANREVAKTAKPGMTLKELNEIAKKVLAAGCMKLGLIEKEDEIDTYYMHGVSHHLGINVHDVTAACNETLQPGAIITDEPGLYIDEWEIGIRIEDDLLITENGCECLSEAIIRDPDEIEAFMKDR